MFDHVARSWRLVKASARILHQDQHLLLFPLISTAAALLVALCFLLPVLGLDSLDGMFDEGGAAPALYAIAFLFYLSQFCVIYFFNAALVSCAMIRLDGGTPTVADGLRSAASRARAILGYALLAATFGMLLRLIQGRAGFVGKLMAGLLGAGATLASYLVVPLLVAGEVGPLQALRESSRMLQRTWSENMIGQGGMGFAFGLVYIGLAAGSLLLLAMILAWMPSAAVFVLVAVAALGGLILTALLHSALAGIYAAVLYRYARSGDDTQGFELR